MGAKPFRDTSNHHAKSMGQMSQEFHIANWKRSSQGFLIWTDSMPGVVVRARTFVQTDIQFAEALAEATNCYTGNHGTIQCENCGRSWIPPRLRTGELTIYVKKADLDQQTKPWATVFDGEGEALIVHCKTWRHICDRIHPTGCDARWIGQIPAKAFHQP